MIHFLQIGSTATKETWPTPRRIPFSPRENGWRLSIARKAFSSICCGEDVFCHLPLLVLNLESISRSWGNQVERATRTSCPLRKLSDRGLSNMGATEFSRSASAAASCRRRGCHQGSLFPPFQQSMLALFGCYWLLVS